MAEASYWFNEVPDVQRFPSYEGDLNVDVAIIGGGIAGISAAYFLSRTGIAVGLFEAGNVVTGDSGYTTAFATHFLDSRETTTLAWQASEAGIELLRKTITEEKIPCEWKDIDGIGFTQKDNIEDFKKDIAALQAVDNTLEYAEEKAAMDMVGFPVRAAYRKNGEGQFHIRKFLLPLLKRAEKQSAHIFEGSEVVGLERGKNIILKTAKGTVVARSLVVASGPSLPQFFPIVSKSLSGAITYVIQINFSNEKPFPRALLWDDLEPYHYFRWASENDLILGGEDWIMKEKKKSTNPHADLEMWLKNIAGGKPFQVLNKWQGSLFYTPDTLPYIGPHNEYGDNIIFLTGWAGTGMAHGFLSGQIAADLLQKKENPYQNLFSFNRSIPPVTN